MSQVRIGAELPSFVWYSCLMMIIYMFDCHSQARLFFHQFQSRISAQRTIVQLHRQKWHYNRWRPQTAVQCQHRSEAAFPGGSRVGPQLLHHHGSKTCETCLIAIPKLAFSSTSFNQGSLRNGQLSSSTDKSGTTIAEDHKRPCSVNIGLKQLFHPFAETWSSDRKADPSCSAYGSKHCLKVKAWTNPGARQTSKLHVGLCADCLKAVPQKCWLRRSLANNAGVCQCCEFAFAT